jgi:hypothetical protein
LPWQSLPSFKAILMFTLTSFIGFLIVDSPGCDIDVIASTCWCHKPFVVRSKLFLCLVYHLNLGCSQSNQFIGFPSPSSRFHGKPTDTRRRGGEIVYFERFLNCKVSSCLDQFFFCSPVCKQISAFERFFIASVGRDLRR